MVKKVSPWCLWFLGSLLFFAEYVVRTSSSVMVGDLMRDFAVNAAGIGTLSAFFYYPYTFMQIPVGAIVDRYPSGLVLTIMAASFAFGSILFAWSNNLIVAEGARALMGFSAAFAFVGTLKLVTENFSPKMLGFLTGATQALGMLGAAIGEGPVAMIVDTLGWRTAMLGMGLFISLVAISLFIYARKIQRGLNNKKLPILQDVRKAIMKNKQVLLNALFAGLLYAPTLAFGELWGLSYLETVQQLPHTTAASLISWIFIGWGLGAPLLGLLSDKIGRRKPIFYFSAFFSLIALSIILLLPLSATMLSFLLFFYGFANSGLVIAYALSGELNSAQQTGLTIAFTNMSSVFIGSCCQPIIGRLLVHYWSGEINAAGSPVYGAMAYQHALLFLPFLLILAGLISFFIKDTNCNKVSV